MRVASFEPIRKFSGAVTESRITLTAIVEDSLRERLARGKARSRKRGPVRLHTAGIRLHATGSGGVRPGVDLDDSASLMDAMDGVLDTAGR